MNKFWFNTWKLIWHAYVDLHMWMLNEQIMIRYLESYLMTCLCWFAQMWLSNEQIVIQCLEPYSITCLCWSAHVDAKWRKLWFDAWKLIWWHAYVDLHMCMSNVQIMIWHLEAYLTTCQFAHVDVKWTNCDSTLRSLFDNMSICTCRCRMNKLWFNTCKLIQHAYVNLQMLNEQIVHLTWILFPIFFQDEQIFVPCAFNMCSWDVEWTPFLYLWKRSQKIW